MYDDNYRKGLINLGGEIFEYLYKD